MLKQISIFSPVRPARPPAPPRGAHLRQAPRRYYVNITPDNIMRHFAPDGADESDASATQSSSQSGGAAAQTTAPATPAAAPTVVAPSAAPPAREENIDELLAGLDGDAFDD